MNNLEEIMEDFATAKNRIYIDGLFPDEKRELAEYLKELGLVPNTTETLNYDYIEGPEAGESIQKGLFFGTRSRGGQTVIDGDELLALIRAEYPDESDNEMPELKTGMIVQFETDRKFLVLTDAEFNNYTGLVFVSLDSGCWRRACSDNLDKITKIYKICAIGVGDMDMFSSESSLIWEREEEPKDLPNRFTFTHPATPKVVYDAKVRGNKIFVAWLETDGSVDSNVYDYDIMNGLYHNNDLLWDIQ